MPSSPNYYETIILNFHNGIYKIFLNRPDKLNTLTEQMCYELIDAFKTINNDSSAKVMVLSANGRAFSAGGDMHELFLQMINDRRSGKKAFNIPAWLSDASQALRNLPVPTIASMHGAAIGFGTTICLQCDIRIASDDAVVGLPFVKLGLIPEFGSTYILPRLVGIAKALELVYTGKNIRADEAREIGLVNMVVPSSELGTTVQALAENIAEGAPLAVRRAKEALFAGLNVNMKQQLKLETKMMRETLISADHEEAVRAFTEKRRPLFKGK
ncbi:MAG: 2-(1,2-epoxy-1,2-dihydrophenyl)acetyl-CoA isomerase [Dehalococcoidia bacterium]|nr:MAG: 2-(1,2-epoxy-1,2-dihydrophenyl)acetyl-CoA isomerase [Dehalococcoidia bacterium]